MNTTIDLSKISLSQGSHKASSGVCINELVSLLAGEEKTDSPSCLCPVIAAFTMAYNDRVSQQIRDRVLLPLAERLVGTRSTTDVERKRAFICADYSVRVFAAGALVRAGLADTLSGLDKIVDGKTAEAARAASWASVSARELRALQVSAAAATSATSQAAAATSQAAAATSQAAAAAAAAAATAAWAASQAESSAAAAAARSAASSDSPESDVIRLINELIEAGK